MTLYTVTSVCEGLLTPETEDWTDVTPTYDTASEQTRSKANITDNRRGNLLHGFAPNRYKEKN